MSLMDKIILRAQQNKQRIVLPESLEERTLTAADRALADELADIILIGNEQEIFSLADKLGLKHVGKATIIDPATSPKTEEYTQLLFQLRQKKGMTIEEARKAAQEQQEQLDAASEGLVQVRIEKSKLEVRVEQAIKVITEENGVLLDIALEIPAPEDRVELEQRRDRLAKRIKGLGNVNPVAVEEYRKLKERRDFIAIQVEDLEGAAKALDRIVAAIDRKMRNRFMETFNQVNANFQDIFQALFPGGQGHLELTDPESPETTGVEVHAQPRGKAVRKQSLLSGGEQSLVSLALLFAVYRVNNTPFYILDEVEAALDDTNLRRLLSYLDTIRGGTQIIMISHQRRTMEMADLLYGVSMRSDGVSKLVSQKLDQAIRSVGGSGGARDVESFTGAQ